MGDEHYIVVDLEGCPIAEAQPTARFRQSPKRTERGFGAISFPQGLGQQAFRPGASGLTIGPVGSSGSESSGSKK